MTMPIVKIEVMISDGKTLTLIPNSQEKKVFLAGLEYGPIGLSRAEVIGLRDMLNIVFPERKES